MRLVTCQGEVDSNKFRWRRYTSELVHIHVSSESKVFRVHKDVFTAASPYFRAAFTGSFSEALSGTLKLEEDLEVFALVVHSVYLHEKFSCQSIVEGGDCLPLIELYRTSSRYQLDHIRDKILECMRNWAEKQHSTSKIFSFITPACVIYAYDNLEEDDEIHGTVAAHLASQVCKILDDENNAKTKEWRELLYAAPDVGTDALKNILKQRKEFQKQEEMRQIEISRLQNPLFQQDVEPRRTSPPSTISIPGGRDEAPTT